MARKTHTHNCCRRLHLTTSCFKYTLVMAKIKSLTSQMKPGYVKQTRKMINLHAYGRGML